MTVKLNVNGNPVAWGKNVEGKDIPDPPDTLTNDPQKRAMWDGSAWVEDPNYTAPYTPEDWAADRKAGNFTSDTEGLDRLAEALDGP